MRESGFADMRHTNIPLSAGLKMTLANERENRHCPVS